MEPKYYTPAIEEFYVGFEYYWRNSDGYTQDELIPNTIKSVEQIIDIQNPIYEIKVKALDREDIESLGWVSKDYDTYQRGEFLLEFNPEYKTFIYEAHPKNSTLFAGTIRNKSELKMIMRMVGIAK